MDPVAAYRWITLYRESDPQLARDAAEGLLNWLKSGGFWPDDVMSEGDSPRPVTRADAENLAKDAIASIERE